VTALVAQGDMPWINSADPPSGKAGDTITVKGANLGSDRVATLYLTDGKADFKVTILEQTSDSIRFRIPAVPAPGRLALMVLTRGVEPQLIQQPVKITVEVETT
jgi:hypothetical protein